MRTNKDVVEAFLRGDILSNTNMTSTGDRLFSYNTCIAERYTYRGLPRCAVNDTKYSVTTSKHHTLLMRGLFSYMVIPYVPLFSIPIGTQFLKPYILDYDI